MRADPFTEAVEEVTDGLRRGYNVKRWRERAFIIEVAKPKLGTSKLPLLIFMILKYHKVNREKKQKY